MKKIMMLLIVLLLLPVMVFADAAGPDFKPYEVEVKKENGVDYYTYRDLDRGIPTGVMPKGTVVKVYFQSVYDDDEIYLGGDYQGKNVYFKASDVVAKGELDVKDAYVYNNDSPVPIKIVDEVIVRKGPSPAFEETGVLEDIETTYTYYTGYPTYLYISYKGVKGWILSSDENILYDGGDYITYRNIRNSCGVIPPNTLLEDIWLNSSRRAKVEYDGCTFEISEQDAIAKMEEKEQIYELNTRVSFYTTVGDYDFEEINSGEEIAVLSREEYDVATYYYIKYKNEKGWIRINLDEDAEYIKEGKKIKDSSSKKQKDDDDDDEDEMDSDTLVIICVIIGIAVALGALGIILYLFTRRKGDNKIEKSA